MIISTILIFLVLPTGHHAKIHKVHLPSYARLLGVTLGISSMDRWDALFPKMAKKLGTDPGGAREEFFPHFHIQTDSGDGIINFLQINEWTGLLKNCAPCNRFKMGPIGRLKYSESAASARKVFSNYAFKKSFKDIGIGFDKDSFELINHPKPVKIAYGTGHSRIDSCLELFFYKDQLYEIDITVYIDRVD